MRGPNPRSWTSFTAEGGFQLGIISAADVGCDQGGALFPGWKRRAASAGRRFPENAEFSWIEWRGQISKGRDAR